MYSLQRSAHQKRHKPMPGAESRPAAKTQISTEEKNMPSNKKLMDIGVMAAFSVYWWLLGFWWDGDNMDS
jgi:hypothetical protein